MKPKTVISLLAAVLILAAASYFLVRDKSSVNKQHQMGTELMKDLPINDIAGITIKDSNAGVDLWRGPSVWQVKNRFDYPADFGKISELLKKLKSLKVGRSFEANDDVLARQKLKDPTDSKAKAEETGTRITLSDKKNKVISDLILGSNRKNNPGGNGGQYLRLEKDKTVYLVNANFAFLDKKPDAWLQNEVIKIDGQEIESITCFSSKTDKIIYRLERKERGKAPELISPPKGETVDSNKIDQVLEALSPLTVEDISGPPRKLEAPLPESSVNLVYRLYNGEVITVYPSVTTADRPENNSYHVILTVDYIQPAASTSKPQNEEQVSTSEKAVKQEEEATDSKPGDGKKAAEQKAKQAENVKQKAIDLNKKLRIWTFTIAKWQYDSFFNTKAELLKSKEKNATN